MNTYLGYIGIYKKYMFGRNVLFFVKEGKNINDLYTIYYENSNRQEIPTEYQFHRKAGSSLNQQASEMRDLIKRIYPKLK